MKRCSKQQETFLLRGDSNNLRHIKMSSLLINYKLYASNVAVSGEGCVVRVVVGGRSGDTPAHQTVAAVADDDFTCL